MNNPNKVKGKKAVRIDKNTIVFVARGTDEKAIIEKYKNRKGVSHFEYLSTYEKLGNKPLVRVRRVN